MLLTPNRRGIESPAVGVMGEGHRFALNSTPSSMYKALFFQVLMVHSGYLLLQNKVPPQLRGRTSTDLF